MNETRLRRKRLAEEDEVDQHLTSPFKRNRAGSAALKWLWAPSTPPDPSTPPPPPPQGLWTYSDPERLFASQPDRGLPPSRSRSRSRSPPPAPTFRHARTRRRGAISVTSPSLSELDRHFAMQLQQQIAIIQLRAAPKNDESHHYHHEEEGGVETEVERMRRGFEGVQIDATLPSILGISLDFDDHKLDLGSSGSPQDSPEGSPREGTSTQILARSPARTSRMCMWDAATTNSATGVHHQGRGRSDGGVEDPTTPTGPGLWTRRGRIKRTKASDMRPNSASDKLS